ncbi:hypothetical protein Agub_g254, partial [Astrephomene gubernaculifera]
AVIAPETHMVGKPFFTSPRCLPATRHVASTVAAPLTRTFLPLGLLKPSTTFASFSDSNTPIKKLRATDPGAESGSAMPIATSTSGSGSSIAIQKPAADRRAYEYIIVGGEGESKAALDSADLNESGSTPAAGARFLLVSDPEAVFAAACLNIQAGYFDDPPDVPGFAHWLEHAVHLGSGRYPDEKDYKYFLSQHGGSSNASTGMVHTSYHFTVAAPHVPGALDRLARFFIDPLLSRESILREVENVHAEWSRNCNSDARKLLQLRRCAAGGPLAQFSTGNATTLRDVPAAAGRDVPAALAAFWRRRYLAPWLCGCVVAPQGLGEMREWVRGAFAGVRLKDEGAEDGAAEGCVETAAERAAKNGEEAKGEDAEAAAGAAGGDAEAAAGGAAAAAAAAGGEAGQGGGGRYCLDGMCGEGQLGRLFRVASQRELRQLEVVWYLPYNMMPYMRSKPWRWAGHVLGHEGRGSLAALLRGAGLAQELSTGPFDEVRLGRGFMFWGVTLTLSEAGLRRTNDVLQLIFAAVHAMRALSPAQRAAVWGEVAAEAEVRWQWQDRSTPLDLARDVAQRLHYFGPQEVLSGPALLSEYDEAALERFLSYLTPHNCNVYLADSSFAGLTQHVEKWYGARYSEEPLPPELYDTAPSAAAAIVDVITPTAATAADATSTSSVAAAAASVDPAGSPDDALPLLLSRLRLPPPPSWALPVHVSLAAPPPAAEPEEIRQQEQQPGTAGASAAAAAVNGAAPADAAPRLLEERAEVRLWHRLDVSFGVPKTHVHVHLITRSVYASPASWVTARLACRLLEELLQPDVYDAQLLGCSYSLSASETGLQLSLHGFSGVVAQLAEMVAEAVAGVSLEQVEARYGLVHGKLLQSLRLWRHNNPSQHAEYGAEHLLQTPHWHAEESIAVLERSFYSSSPAAAAASVSSSSSAAAAAASVSSSSSAAAAAASVSSSSSAAAAAASVSSSSSAAAAAAAAASSVPAEGEEGRTGPREVWEVLQGLGRGMALEVLVYGNSTEQQARELCATMERHLRPTGLGPDGWPATYILQLGPLAPDEQQQVQDKEEDPTPSPVTDSAAANTGAFGTDNQAAAAASGAASAAAAAATEVAAPALFRFLPPNPNPANSNSAVFYLCQVCEDDPADPLPAVLLELLTAIASKPAFHELRTRQRLGYSVSLGEHRLGGVVGLVLRIQSPDRSPGELRQRVTDWLADFEQELAALSPQRLDSFKTSLTERYTEPPRSLAEASRRTWQPIRYRSYAFDKRGRKAAALRDVTLPQLLDFHLAHVKPAAVGGARSGARVLCCEVWGGGRGGGGVGGVKASGGVKGGAEVASS